MIGLYYIDYVYVTLSVGNVQDWVLALANFAMAEMESLKIFEIYRKSGTTYGPIITFNVRRADGLFLVCST